MNFLNTAVPKPTPGVTETDPRWRPTLTPGACTLWDFLHLTSST